MFQDQVYIGVHQVDSDGLAFAVSEPDKLFIDDGFCLFQGLFNVRDLQGLKILLKGGPGLIENCHKIMDEEIGLFPGEVFEFVFRI